MRGTKDITQETVALPVEERIIVLDSSFAL